MQNREDEAFWVLEGELEFLIGEVTIRERWIFHTRPQRHSTRPRERGNGTRARFLTLMAPAGLEKFFEEVGKPGTDLSSPPPLDDAEIEKLMATAPKYGIEIPSPPSP